MTFSPCLRARITRTVYRSGAWRGCHHGVLCEIVLDRRNPPGWQIIWGMCRARRWTRGLAGDVFHALLDMERVYGKCSSPGPPGVRRQVAPVNSVIWGVS